MKYKLTKDIPGMGSKGMSLTTSYSECIYYENELNSEMDNITIYPHELALLLHAGLLEEVEEGKIELWEEMPLHDTKYWYLDSFGNVEYHSVDIIDRKGRDAFRFKSKNMHKTRESAEEALRLIMES